MRIGSAMYPPNDPRSRNQRSYRSMAKPTNPGPAPQPDKRNDPPPTRPGKDNQPPPRPPWKPGR